MAAAMFMNSNSLPIALMQSLVITVPGLKWGDDDNKDAMVGRALTYLVLHSTLGMVVCPIRQLSASQSVLTPCRSSFDGAMVFIYSHKPTQNLLSLQLFESTQNL